MHEKYPGHVESEGDPTFSIDPEVGYGFSRDDAGKSEPGIRRDVFISDMSAYDEELPVALAMLEQIWDVPEMYADDFIEGAAAAHKLLAFQASFTDSDLPALDPDESEVIDDYFEDLPENWESGSVYLDARENDLIDNNNVFIQALYEYIETDQRGFDFNSTSAFMLGAISLFDVLNHLSCTNNVNEMMNRYKGSHDFHVKTSPEEFAVIVTRMGHPDHDQDLRNMLDL